MSRGPRYGDGVVAFHLIEEDIDPRDEVLVGDRLDGPSGKEFHAVHAVGDDVVGRGGVRRQVPAPLLDPVEGVVHCTEFAGVARGSPSAKPSIQTIYGLIALLLRYYTYLSPAVPR